MHFFLVKFLSRKLISKLDLSCAWDFFYFGQESDTILVDSCWKCFRSSMNIENTYFVLILKMVKKYGQYKTLTSTYELWFDNAIMYVVCMYLHVN